MTRKKKNIISFIMLLLCLPSFGFAQNLPTNTYVVKAGDTLSGIALSTVGKPIYGKNGGLSVLSALNPEIANLDRIKPGTLIYLPSKDASSNAKSESVARSIANESSPPSSAAMPTESKTEPQKVTQENLPLAQSKYRTWLGFSYDRIDSIDNASKVEATMLSSLNPTIGVAWDMTFGATWGLGLEAQVTSQEIQKNITSSRAIEGNHHYLGAMAFSVFRFETDADLRISLGTSETVFPRTLSNSDIMLDKVVVPFVKLEHTWKWHVVRNGDLGLGGTVSYLLPSQGVGYDVESGFGASAHFQWTHSTQDHSLSGRFNYSLEKQDSSYVEQQKSSIGLQLIYTGPLL